MFDTLFFNDLVGNPGALFDVFGAEVLVEDGELFHGEGADSGALVVDAITSGGKTDSPVPQRVFWACMLGVTASMLLYGGGRATLQSLQAGTITAALPFTSIVLASCISLFLGVTKCLPHRRAAIWARIGLATYLLPTFMTGL